MKVTDIKAQHNQTGTCAVFVDGRYCVSLSEPAVLASGVIVGQELDGKQLQQLRELAAADELYHLTLHYLTVRPRSTWEVRTYLERKGSPAPLVEETLNKLSDMQLLDDRAFARQWIGSRRVLKPSSKLKLAAELRTKHINEEIIAEALSATEVNDQQALEAIVARKRRQASYRDDLKLMRYLAGLGFKYEDIKAAVRGGTEF